MHTPHDEKIARQYKALAHPRRMMLLRILVEAPTGQLTFSQLVVQSGLRPSSLSHHLREMARSGLLHNRRKGANVFFFLTPQALSRASTHVHTLCSPQRLISDKAA